jgi:5-methyltetrahydrofolate corrinoid/iron sulfur protein methyltransferase
MRIIADNIQITDPAVAKALSELDPAPIQDLARRCEAAGADMLDINPGPLTRDGGKRMVFLVEAVQEVCDLPLSLDTSNPSAMKAGLGACRRKPTINGFSLEPVKMEKILPLARDVDCDVIGFLLHPDGTVPLTVDERAALAVELFEGFSEQGIAPERLIIDPVLVPLMWEDGARQAMDLLSLIRMLPEVLGFSVKTVAGLSNLTSGKGPRSKKYLLERAYLPMLASAGLDHVLMNVDHQETVSMVRASKAITRQGTFTWEEII